MAVLAKRVNHLTQKLKVQMTEPTRRDDWKIELRSSKSPLARPKKLLSNISSKTLSFIHKKSKKKKEGVEWGHGGVWQKAILMGDKCELLDFSGVIYYDSNGQQVNEIPLKSPYAGPVTGYFIRHRQRKL